jgi:hypothetical protein
MGVKEKPDIIDIIERKRLQWYGHVKKMQEVRLPKLIMEWILGERRKRGRPRNMVGSFGLRLRQDCQFLKLTFLLDSNFLRRNWQT